MKPRERVLAVLNGQRPDKVPFTVYECMIPQCAVERRLRNEGLCIVNRSQAGYTTRTPNCTTTTLSYNEDGKPRRRTVVQTPVGEICEVRQPAGFTEWTLERYFKSPDDYKVLEFMLRDKVYEPSYEAFREAEDWMGADVLLRGAVGSNPLHRIMGWMGHETFAVEWYERRDEVLKLERIMRRNRRKVYRILADSPITHANFGGNEVPEVMGIERFRDYVLPLLNECAEEFHRTGKLLGSHLDGNNRPWAHLVAESKLDYVEAFTPAPDTDMTLKDALEAWPDKVLWIHFPSSLQLADHAKIKETTRRFVELARETNRVIIGITEDMPPDRWQGNLLAISEVINDMPF